MNNYVRLAIVALVGLNMLTNAGTGCLAADSASLADENAKLQQRVDQLDKQLQEIKKTVAERAVSADTPVHKPVWSNLDIQLYGYLKLDAAYDSSRIDNGNYAKWVERENANSNDDQFNMTANETRLGMMINGPDDPIMKASGRVEVDFYGSGDGENKPHLMMRHAYLKLDWPADRFSILAGQTSDVVSPLFPSTVNYSVGWWTGNIGYRRPQIRLTKEYDIGPKDDLKLEGALARTIGRTSFTGTDSGEDSGVPSAQARASMSLPLFAGIDASTVGVSGHLAQEEYDVAANGRNKEFTSWSLNLDLTQPVNKWLSIKSEVFTGENLDAYLGGIGQGVTTTGANQYEEVGSKGGWIAAALGPWDKARFNVGLGMDDVDRGNVNTGDRTLNQSVFGNVYCSLSKNVEWAFELSHWRTEYRGPGDGDAVRAQTALIYRF